MTLNGQERKNPPCPKILDGRQEARLIAVRLGPPPKGISNWSRKPEMRNLGQKSNPKGWITSMNGRGRRAFSCFANHWQAGEWSQSGSDGQKQLGPGSR